MRALAKIVPLIAGTNILIACFVLWTGRPGVLVLERSLWAGALCLSLLPFVYLAVRNHRMRLAYTSGERTKTRPSISGRATFLNISTFFHGTVWGFAAPLMASAASDDMKIVLAVAMACLVLGSSIFFSPMASLAVMFLVPVVGFSLYALSLEAQTSVVFTLYLAAVCIGGSAMVSASVVSKFHSRYLGQLVDAKGQSILNHKLLNELQQKSSEWIWETDRDGFLQRFPEYMLPTGARLGDVKLVDYLARVSNKKNQSLQPLFEAMDANEPFDEIVFSAHWGRGESWLKMSGQPLLDDDGQVVGFRGIGCDITSEKLAEDRIARLTESDTLTGVLNRSTFSEHLAKAVANLERYGKPFTVLYLDLDNFRLINDTRGHLAGDRILTEASERIADEVREVDSVARLGGDEFAILMVDQGDAGAAARLSSRIISEVSKPYFVDGEEFKLGISIGIALAPLNGTRPDQLLRNADLALYRAKADGRGVFRFFESNMDSELRERRMLEVELRDAASNNELVLHYQPLVDAQTHATVAMESLVRWEHPIRGLLSPAEFIELAERANLISEIGAWTLNKACETAVNWPNNVIVAVNLSAHHFMQTDIVSEVSEALMRARLRPQRLELEITESLLIHNAREVNAKLNALKDLGVSVAMDDFGTGYSSLSYLMSVPFDKLKIDKSFVDQVCITETGKKIVRMITTLGKELGLKITAEGVEDAEQAAFLAEIGCDTLQGYHFSKPLPESELASYFLAETRKAAGLRDQTHSTTQGSDEQTVA